MFSEILYVGGDSSNAGGTGTVTIASGNAVTTSNTAMTLIGANHNIAGTLNSGSGNVTIGQSVTSQALALGTATSALLTDTELDLITTTGTLTIGQASPLMRTDIPHGIPSSGSAARPMPKGKANSY